MLLPLPHALITLFDCALAQQSLKQCPQSKNITLTFRMGNEIDKILADKLCYIVIRNCYHTHTSYTRRRRCNDVVLINQIST